MLKDIKQYLTIVENSFTYNSTDNRSEQVSQFVSYTLDRLGCESIPTIELSYNIDTVKQNRSFGNLDPTTGKIWVYVANRNLADILRTICHEIVHYKQLEDGKLSGIDDGRDGSPIENEANSVAAVIMREYGRSNPEIYE